MRRYIVVLLVVSLLVAVLAFPVSAASDEPLYHDVLSQGVVSSSNTVGGAYLSTNLTFTTYPVSIYYVDFIVSSPRDLNEVCSKISFYDMFDLTCVSLGNNLYRCFGSYNGGGVLTARTTFTVKYYTTSPASLNSISYKSFNVGFVPVDHFESVTDLEIQYGIFNGAVGGTADVSMEDPNTTYRVTFPTTEDLQDGWYSYRVIADCLGWKKYDYVEFGFCARVGTVESISAKTTDGQVLDCDVSYLITNSSGDVVEIINNVPFNWPDTNPDRVYITVRVDLTSLNRDSSGAPQLYITGAYNSWTSTGALPAYFEVTNYSGYIKTAYLSEEVSLSKRIKTLLESWNTKLPQWFDELGDRIEAIFADDSDLSSSANVGEQRLDAVQDYENELWNDFDSQIDPVIDAFDVTSFAAGLGFIAGILDRTFNNLGEYQIVIILPIALGITLFIMSRARGVDVPRKNAQFDYDAARSEVLAARAAEADSGVEFSTITRGGRKR